MDATCGAARASGSGAKGAADRGLAAVSKEDGARTLQASKATSKTETATEVSHVEVGQIPECHLRKEA